MNPKSKFFVTGGSLGPDSPSYVPREADEELFTALRAGEFCYVLTSRQRGKSSLMVRTAERLRQDGVRVARLDVTAFGQNVTAEQWYFGLLGKVGEDLGQEDALEAFWNMRPRLGPLQRLMEALRHVVLTDSDAPVVIFIDEIDFVRSLPFPTDEFFAAIRECYNRRSEDPAYGRLTFCLLGVASPSDLIRDPQLTPFNIGRRIQLTDFTAREAARLEAGFLDAGAGCARDLVRRVLHWTGGHPYLTQTLCAAVAQSEGRAAADVDRECRRLFLVPEAPERGHFAEVTGRLKARGTEDAARLRGLLRRYRWLFLGWPVADNDDDSTTAELHLAGLVRGERGWLRVRNRIYRRLFGLPWIAEVMPPGHLSATAVRATALVAAACVVVSLSCVVLHTARRASAVKGGPSNLGVSLAWASSAAGEARAITAKYAPGSSPLTHVYLRVGSSVDNYTALWARCDMATKQLYLCSDDHKSWPGGGTAGSHGVIRTAQGSLDIGATTVTASAAEVTVRWVLIPPAKWAGTTQPVHQYCEDQIGRYAGWDHMGTWTIKR